MWLQGTQKCLLCVLVAVIMKIELSDAQESVLGEGILIPILIIILIIILIVFLFLFLTQVKLKT